MTVFIEYPAGNLKKLIFDSQRPKKLDENANKPPTDIEMNSK
jgi:hypothetical protein